MSAELSAHPPQSPVISPNPGLQKSLPAALGPLPQARLLPQTEYTSWAGRGDWQSPISHSLCQVFVAHTKAPLSLPKAITLRKCASQCDKPPLTSPSQSGRPRPIPAATDRILPRRDWISPTEAALMESHRGHKKGRKPPCEKLSTLLPFHPPVTW